jgi:hypothetical protein
MSEADVVAILRRFVADDGREIERRFGTQAATEARNMAELLVQRLDEDGARGVWENFESDPEDHAAELSGTLEAMAEADAGLARRLDGFLLAYNRLITPEAVGESPEDEDDESEELADEQEYTDAVDMDPLIDARIEKEDADADAEGLYLYGNMRDSVVEVGGELRETDVGSELPIEPEFLGMDAAEVRRVIDEVDRIVNETVERDPEQREALMAEIERVKAVTSDQDPTEELLVRHLARIEDISPDVYELVLAQLAGMQQDFDLMLQTAVKRLRER